MIQTIKWDGHAISEPGLYGGIPLDTYHAANICDGPSISSSGLRTIFNESPAHFFVEWRGNPNRIESKESRALIIGRAVHHLILGEPFFAKLFAIQPEEYESEKGSKPWNNNANDCKKWHAARHEEGRTVLLRQEVENIRGMAESLGAHPIIRAGALNGLIERSIFWKDHKSGIWLKSRPDSIPGDSGDFVDLKTTDSVQRQALVRTIGKFGYHQQGALVRQAAREVLGIENPTFTLVFVEKEPPWCVRVVTLKDSDLDRGDKQNRIALDQFAACLKSKHWPGPGGDREDAEYIELGDYEKKRIDDEINILAAG
jgi:hypothetical protein